MENGPRGRAAAQEHAASHLHNDSRFCNIAAPQNQLKRQCGVDGTPLDEIRLIPGQGQHEGTPGMYPEEFKKGIQSASRLPFPLYDPRLFWDPRRAELSDALPQPILPHDWKLIGWLDKSLLVVCADPWHQIFTLTPLGPKLMSLGELIKYDLWMYVPVEDAYLHPLVPKREGQGSGMKGPGNSKRPHLPLSAFLAKGLGTQAKRGKSPVQAVAPTSHPENTEQLKQGASIPGGEMGTTVNAEAVILYNAPATVPYSETSIEPRAPRSATDESTLSRGVVMQHEEGLDSDEINSKEYESAATAHGHHETGPSGVSAPSNQNDQVSPGLVDRGMSIINAGVTPPQRGSGKQTVIGTAGLVAPGNNTNLAHQQHSILPSYMGQSADEARYCPNGLGTLAEGYFWLARVSGIREAGPAIINVSQGSIGAIRRRYPIVFKHPIAFIIQRTVDSLGQAYVPNAPLTTHYLRPFDGLWSVAMPDRVNLHVIGDVDVLLYEKICYFSNYYAVDEFRAYCRARGLKNGDLANFINMVRGLEGEHAIKNNTIAAREKLSRHKGTRPNVNLQDLTVRHWNLPKHGNMGSVVVQDYPLLGIQVGVRRPPVGPYQEGPLTKLLKWCIANNRCNAKLSDVQKLLAEAGISPRVNAPYFVDPDAMMVQELLGEAAAYGKRIKSTFPPPVPQRNSRRGRT